VDAKDRTSVTPARDDVTGDEITWSENQDGGDVTCQLKPRELWDKFHELGTEMIITKSGRFVIHIRTAFRMNVTNCMN